MDNQTIIIAVSLALGIGSGFVMHRSDFCIAGIFRDLFLFRHSPLLPSLLLTIAASTILFEMARLGGLLHYQLPSSLFGVPALTTLLGGILFGIGMVLAGGCVVGVLYKMGAGQTPAMIAVIGLIFGSILYAEFHPAWKQLATVTKLSDAATLPQFLDMQTTSVYLVMLALLGALLWQFQKQGKIRRPNQVKGYLQPALAGLFLAVIGVASFTLTGMPLGITTSYAKVGSFFEKLLLPEHFSSLAYFQGRGFQYFSPLSQQTLTAGAGPFWDGLSLVQFPLISGIVIGSGISAWHMGKFQLRFKLPRAQLVSALLGGIMMGLASRMTPACNVWHLLGGLPLLALQSLLFAVGLLPGAWLGSRLLTRYVL